VVRCILLASLGLVLLGCSGGGGGLGSVGAVFGRDNETNELFVREVPRGLGADQAGLRPGDHVMMIDGWYVKDLRTREISERLRGEPGSTVAITVVRGEEVRHLKVTRGVLREHQAVKPPREERITE
jgi:C-terminal processing protease CtpA/Prc